MAQGILIVLKRRSRMIHLPIWGPLGPTLIQGVIGLVLAIALAVVAAAMISPKLWRRSSETSVRGNR